jgi:uracil phosphoribosyltransferase-like protein
MLGYEASRDLEEIIVQGVSIGITNLSCMRAFPLTDRTIQHSPITTFKGSVVKPRVGFTPVLRAGLGMTDSLLTLFPCVHRRSFPSSSVLAHYE